MRGSIALAMTMLGCASATPSAPVQSTASPSPSPSPSPSTPTSTSTSTSTATPTATATAPPPSPPAPKSYRRILSAGDSFNGAFSLALEKHFRADGVLFVRDTWVAVAISTFARDARFGALVDKTDPDLVLVNLGANDIDDADPESVVKHVRAIVARIGDRDCFWIAPALWKKDSGIVDVLAKNVAPCRFFDSKGFKVKRGKDGWHPSVEGGALWADRFWDFFQQSRATTNDVAPP